MRSAEMAFLIFALASIGREHDACLTAASSAAMSLPSGFGSGSGSGSGSGRGSH
jgi:hypothetical protein